MLQSPLFPNLGLGLGLRRPHYMDVMEGRSKAQWFEVITENQMGLGIKKEGRSHLILEKVREHYPIVFHGVSLSIGGTDSLNKAYLQHLKKLVHQFEPAWFSDHLCWTGVKGENLHDLLPLPYTPSAAKWVAERIQKVQDFMGRQMLIENVSSYINYSSSDMQEWEFFKEVVEAADCAILLDINNIFVSSVNHGFDPYEYLNHLPAHRVAQIHLAGHTTKKGFMIDTHDHPVTQEVLKLYKYFVDKNGFRSTMIEWDDRIPSLQDLERELDKVKKLVPASKEDHGNSKGKKSTASSAEANF